MKKIIPYILVGYISIIGGLNCASAQKMQSFKFKDITFEKPGQPQFQPVESAAAQPSLVLEPASINKKILKQFSRSFKDAVDATWSETKEGEIMVKFSKGNVKSRAFYHAKGGCFATILDYSVENLRGDIRQLVKSNYVDFNISHIAEVSIDGKTAYVITLKGETTWKIIRVIDGDIIEDATYING